MITGRTDDEKEKKEMKVVFFGAGKQLSRFLHESKIKNYISIVAIVDNDSDKWGKLIEGHAICPPNTLQELEFDKIAVSTFDYYNEICSELVCKYCLEKQCIMKLEEFIVPELFDTGSIIFKDVIPNAVYDFKDLLPEKMILNNKFEEFFFNGNHKIIHKLWHYFEVYEFF